MENNPDYVSDLTVVLRNKSFLIPWKAVEALIDIHCAGNHQTIGYQGESDLEITWDNLVRVDYHLMQRICAAITPDYFKDMKIIAPCDSRHTRDNYTPLALVIQFKLPSHKIQINLDGELAKTAYNGNRINPSLPNLSSLSLPPNLQRGVCSILNELHTERGEGVAVFLKNVLYASAQSTLIVIDPPTYNYFFIDTLLHRYPGVIKSIVFEQTPRESGKGKGVSLLIALYDSKISHADPSSGYIRVKPSSSSSSSRKGGFLSRLGLY